MSRVLVEAPARLHMGFLSVSDERRWAGIGLGIEEPRTTVEVEVSAGDRRECIGPGSEVAAWVAALASKHLSISYGYKVTTRSAPPAHIGLGSTTQLALSVWAALSVLGGSKPSVEEAVRLGVCGRRSWIGIAAFKSGGFILDLGAGAGGIHPYLTLPFPSEWAVVLCIPHDAKGLSGRIEEEKMDKLSYGPSTRKRLSEIVLGEILPGVLERDLGLFGHGLETAQRVIGEEFRELQGGVYNPSSEPWIAAMKSAGLLGVGQSSWGPTLYGFAESWEEGVEAADTMARSPGIDILVTRACNRGAAITKL